MKRAYASRLQPVRWLLWALSLLTTAAGTYVFAEVLATNHVQWLYLPLLALFAILFLWTAMSFWTATLGFLVCLFRPPARHPLNLPAVGTDWPPPDAFPRTAILMPVYNENPAHVAAGLRATLESLGATGYGRGFDLFILSDTTDPDVWLKEELAWASLRAAFEPGIRVFYRRRPRNTSRKSGNIADFCERWGSQYRYMAILDADSVMTGTTLVEMIRQMEADQQIGILQAPVVPVNHDSLWARGQQFAARVYGDAFTAGFALWTQTDGNYYGHNAMIRIAPFMRHCGLPTLPGRAPLGGEILSHDFVEAALMRRAGWKVVMAHGLAGSYEECPATLSDHAQRDQRWCQGNLQHVRLVFTCGLHPISRVHLGMGAMAYVSSPLWLLFMLLAAASAIGPSQPGAAAHTPNWPAFLPGWVAQHAALTLFLVTLALLLLPKLWGYVLLLVDRERCRTQGGAMKAGASVLLDTLICVLTAPILMAFHTAFVLSTLLGTKVEWLPQRRHESGITLREAVHAHLTHTLAGLSAGLAIALWAPGLFWWMVPVLTGLVFSVPLDMCLGSVRVGAWLATHGLLLIPEETQTPPILRQQRRHLEAGLGEFAVHARISPIHQLVVDPAFLSLHLAMLPSIQRDAADSPPDRLNRIKQIALHGSPMYLTRAHKLALLSDAAALRWLHREVWAQWPVNLLKLA